MAQSSIKWLENEIKNGDISEFINDIDYFDKDTILSLLEHARNMHLKEIRSAFNDGFIEGFYKNDDRYDETRVKCHNSKDYYDKTFGNDTP
jgi:hypothetical protein